MEIEEDELTAYHEAGHVVMALQTGGTIIRATTVPQWRSDWERVLVSAMKFSNSESKARQLIDQVMRSVHQQLDSENGWAAVAAIADLLLTHETVEHAQCQEAVGFWLRR